MDDDILDKFLDVDKEIKELKDEIGELKKAKNKPNKEKDETRFMIGDIEIVLDSDMPPNEMYMSAKTLEKMQSVLGMSFYIMK